MARYDLTDFEWKTIEPLLLSWKAAGGRRSFGDHVVALQLLRTDGPGLTIADESLTLQSVGLSAGRTDNSGGLRVLDTGSDQNPG